MTKAKTRKSRSKRTNPFRGRVAESAKRQKEQTNRYGYLKIGKDIDVYNENFESKFEKFDILPYEVTDPNHLDRDDGIEAALLGNLWYKRPFFIHRNIGANNDTVVCRKTDHKKCPICEYMQARLKKGAEWDDVSDLKPSKRNLYVVVPIDNPDYEEVPHIWDISDYCFQDLLTEELETRPENEIFPSLHEGLILKVRFSEEKIGENSFADASRIDFEERDYEYDEDILEDVPDLDSVLDIMDYDALEAKFKEIEVEATTEEVVEEPDEPATKRRKKKTAKEGSQKTMRRKKKKTTDSDSDYKSKRTKKVKRTKKTSENDSEDGECPYGHEFGVDTDEFQECDECDRWDDCLEEKTARENQ